jgi:membrane protease YdiL (CAAX protease family)
MNRLTAETGPQEHSAVHERKESYTPLILTAWLGTLLLSRLPQILLSELGLSTPTDWSIWWWIILGAALIVLTYVWAAVKSLRGYFLILTMIYVFTILLSLFQGASFWTSWFGSERSSFAVFFGDRLGIVLMAMALAGVLSLRGQNHRDYFLTFGDVNAPAGGMHLHWAIAGPMLAMSPLPASALDKVIHLIPATVILALMNAFGEELAYRAAPLSQLLKVVGKSHALWMTALWFGLGHYYGGISFGSIGAIFFTFVAVLFGKAMVETKGLAIPVFMHILGDLVLYIILALDWV